MVAKARYDIVAQDKTERAANSVRRRLSGIRESVFSLRGAFAGLAGVLATGALARGITNTVNNLEAINRQAEALDATRERIQELTFTFRQYNLEQDDVADTLGTLSDRAQDAKDGMKSFQDDFALLNITVEDLRNKRPGELFELVASRVAQIEDPTRRTAAVVRIFGDDLGRQLLPLLQQGATGLRDYAKQAEEAGAVMRDELVKEGAEAAKTFRELRETITAQFTRTVAENADEFARLAGALTDAAIGGAKFLEFLVGHNEVEELNDQIEATRQKLETLQDVGPGFGRSAEAQRASDIASEYGGWEKAVDALNERLKTLKQRQMEVLTGPTPTQDDVTVDLMNRLAGGPTRGGRGGPPERPESPDFEGRQTSAIRLQHTRGRDRMAYADALAEIRDQADQTRERVVPMWEEINAETRDANEATQQLGFTFSSAFEDAIVKGNDFRSVLKGIADDVLRIFVRTQVSQPAGNALAEMFSGMFGGGAGLMADPLPGSRGRATGGPVTAGQSYLVGERGPELFRPRGSGEVVPNDRLGAGRPVVNNNVTINAPGADAAGLARVEQQVEGLNRTLERRAVDAVVDDGVRGGKTRTVFAG